MDPTQPPAGQQHFDNPLEVTSPGEQTIMEITRHPFGLIGLYLSGGLIVLLLLLAAALLPHYATSLSTQDKTGLFAGALVLIAIVLLYLYVAATIYKGNRWVVTSDSITEITQVGLFRKRTSQLSLANLEDVTFEQTGLVQSMFGFGTLRVETAGEHSKFFFTFCPKPADCAKRIISAHEQFIASSPEETRKGNEALTATQQYNQPPPLPSPNPLPPSPPTPPPPSSQPPEPMGYTVPTGPEDDQQPSQ